MLTRRRRPTTRWPTRVVDPRSAGHACWRWHRRLRLPTTDLIVCGGDARRGPQSVALAWGRRNDRSQATPQSQFGLRFFELGFLLAKVGFSPSATNLAGQFLPNLHWTDSTGCRGLEKPGRLDAKSGTSPSRSSRAERQLNFVGGVRGATAADLLNQRDRANASSGRRLRPARRLATITPHLHFGHPGGLGWGPVTQARAATELPKITWS